MKLGYYRDHHWEEEFIEQAKEDVAEIYKARHAPSTVPQARLTRELDDDDDLLQHIYKRRKSSEQHERDELDMHLTASTAGYKTDILLWWKVS
jgi:hypothetical protein